MNRVIRDGAVLISACLFLTPVIGCDYSPPPSAAAPTGNYRPGITRETSKKRASSAPEIGSRDETERAAILTSSIKLIQGAALQPGGDNFKLATQKLIQYFEGTPRTAYMLEPSARAYLQSQIPAQMIPDLEATSWTLRDARHLEDCMMYYGIASRVAGTGDDLTRVRRVFDWIVEQIQLVPAGSLGGGRLRQVFARPYDLLLRGMATESEGFWAERAWLFMALCRQLGIDAGLITYTKGNVVEPMVPGAGPDGTKLLGSAKPTRAPVAWICAALIDDKAYLFDARVGLPIPGPGGQGVATLEQTLTDPSVLERMDLPGQSPYETSLASLVSSSSKIGILIDSSLGYFTPKMKLLQQQLAGENRTILYRDPADQRGHFAQVLGDRCGEVRLWSLPIEVETRLFTDPQFVQSIQQSLFLFRPEFPLIYARIKHLRGEFSKAIEEYVSFRFGVNVPIVNDKQKRTIPKEVQEGLDAYATYYLALAHLERNSTDQAELMFRKLLEILPEPGPNQPYFNMFRWGAHTNLGRIYEAMGDNKRAIAHFSQSDPTFQRHGNLLKARELVWKDPMAAQPDPLPPAPVKGKLPSSPIADTGPKPSATAQPAQPR